MCAWKLAPALAAGCSQAVKPAEETPLSALAFARIYERVAREVGAPAAAFSVIYPLRTGHWHGHPHNIAIDLAVSHGLPVALLVVGVVLWLLIRGARLGMASGPVFERGWWASVLVLVALHATDMPLYDSRINIAGWILLAGLRCYGQSGNLIPASAAGLATPRR
jgi:hypothetical protein